VGVGTFTLLTLRFGRPRLSLAACFLSFGLALLVLVSPNGIGIGYGLDYRLVVPTATVAVCGMRFSWRTLSGRWIAFGVLLIASLARTASFAHDFWRDEATFMAFRQVAATLHPDSVLLTGIGTRREAIPWAAFWAPPTEYLGTGAVAAHVFVPTVFAIASQHPIAANDWFSGWQSFALYDSSDDEAASAPRVKKICAEWPARGHTGQVLMLLAYPSAESDRLIPPGLIVGFGPGFRVADICPTVQ
jgi:hypothetical protein